MGKPEHCLANSGATTDDVQDESFGLGAFSVLLSQVERGWSKISCLFVRVSQRDRAGLSTWFMNNIMPDTAVEDQFVWADRRTSGSVFLFDRLVIVDVSRGACI